MKSRWLGVALVVSFLGSGCGILIGQMMASGTGVKDFQVRQGDLRDFGAAKQVLVYAPFTKAEGAWVLCRGEDEALLAEDFQKEGLFRTSYYLERDLDKATSSLATLLAQSPDELKAALHLKETPDAILSGTLLSRDENVAPTVGVIQTVRFRLDLTTLATGKTASVEVAVKALHKDAVPMVAKELKRRVAGG